MTPTGSTASTSTDQKESAAKEINRIFIELKAIFPGWGASIANAEIDAEMRRQWLRGILESGIRTREQIDGGLAIARKQSTPFLPSIGQFVSWCNQAYEASTGFPSEFDALAAMTREFSKPAELRDWTAHHGAVYWAFRSRDSYDWKNYDEKKLQAVFKATWNKARQLNASGHEFIIPLPAPEQSKEHIQSSPETAQSHISSLMDMLK